MIILRSLGFQSKKLKEAFRRHGENLGAEGGARVELDQERNNTGMGSSATVPKPTRLLVRPI